ncbi:MAG: hypothetical protein ACI9JN_000344 [Bacteroidia bacterium]|jgi:hypothetical protein
MNLLRRISIPFAVKTLLLISTIALVFHIFILTGLIPYQYVWGGRLESKDQMIQFESVSLIVNVFIIIIVAMKGAYLKPALPNKLVRVFLWIFTIMFGLNTIGNLVSLNSLEAIIATPITLVLAIMLLRLAVHK